MVRLYYVVLSLIFATLNSPPDLLEKHYPFKDNLGTKGLTSRITSHNLIKPLMIGKNIQSKNINCISMPANVTSHILIKP